MEVIIAITLLLIQILLLSRPSILTIATLTIILTPKRKLFKPSQQSINIKAILMTLKTFLTKTAITIIMTIL